MGSEISPFGRACRPAVSATAAIALLSAALLLPTEGHAEDELVMIDVAEAMATPEYGNALDGSVRFFFGNTPHPAVEHEYGNFVTNKKTNAFFKDAGVACRHVLLSALIALQNQAKSLGGNGVINIHSYFKKNEASHDDDAECYKGFLMAGVALKGDVVRLSN